jgi:hypothetical protein
MGTAPTTATPELTINLRWGDTPASECRALAERFYALFTTPRRGEVLGAFEEGVSILVIPERWEEYWESPSSYWLRQRVRRARRDGYRFAEIDRNRYLDDIYAINTSLPVRQGRPMSDAYLRRPDPYPPLPETPCPRHRLYPYGVLRDDHLYAYAWVYVIGEVCLFSTILGHGGHLKSGIMPLLIYEAVHDLRERAALRYAMYHLHGSGTEGLRFFKEQMGFRAARVRWLLGDGRDDERAAAREERAPARGGQQVAARGGQQVAARGGQQAATVRGPFLVGLARRGPWRRLARRARQWLGRLARGI